MRRDIELAFEAMQDNRGGFEDLETTCHGVRVDLAVLVSCAGGTCSIRKGLSSMLEQCQRTKSKQRQQSPLVWSQRSTS